MSTTDDFTDRDLDALISGRAVRDARLAELEPAMAVLRASAAAKPSDEQVSSMALAMSRAVPATTDGGVAGSPARRAPRRANVLSRRLAAAVAGAGLLGVGFAGAAAADDSAPGDALYGVDRALEAVGINDGGAHERLLEVRALLDDGDVDGALLHAEEATDELDPEATESLRAAAAAVASAGSDQSREVREQVAAMLTWMAETDLEGRDFGQGVAERARAIGGKSDDAPGASDRTQRSDRSVPPHAGKPDNAGPPADAGKPDSAGQSDDAGRPDAPENAGPPADAGKPDSAGQLDSAGKPDDAGAPENAGPPADAGKPDNAGRPDGEGEQRGGSGGGKP